MTRFFAFSLLLAAIASFNTHECLAIAKPESTDTLNGLRKGHPRLFLTPERLQAIKTMAATDPILAAMVDQIIQDAETKLTQSPVEHKIPDGKRLLSQSRRAIDRVCTFSLAYHLSKDRRFLDAATKEMLVAAAFKDWNPSHFLDTAEMTTALAIGYDWLYNDLNPKARETICRAIIQLGMQPGFACFEKKARYGWWTESNHNWNQVCNGGLILGTLAIADEKPGLAKQMIEYCLQSIPKGLAEYQPDGSYPEGPGYWVYGTSYSVLTMLACDSALGHDFGINKHAGLDRTAKYRLHMAGPLDLYFNYADCGVTSCPSFATLGLAHIYQQLGIAQLHLESVVDYYRLNSEDKKSPKERFYTFNVIYYPENSKKIVHDNSQQLLPLDVFFVAAKTL